MNYGLLVLLVVSFGFFESCEKKSHSLIANSSINNKTNHHEVLVWFDEFDNEGLIDSNKWKAEVFPPNDGSWFNDEVQHYTSRKENAYISEGTLKIVAIKEDFTAYGSTKKYTSARLNSVFNFTYGRVEVRAKLPKGQGTWPAIWTLGQNMDKVGWPACGEIDIMEQLFENQFMVQCALHTPSSYGNTQNLKQVQVSDVTENFHVYAMDWQEHKIDFFVDGQLYYTYNPNPKNDQNWPFYRHQFILLNIAMGGTLGGTIDPQFTDGVMEVDYVRVYQ